MMESKKLIAIPKFLLRGRVIKNSLRLAGIGVGLVCLVWLMSFLGDNAGLTVQAQEPSTSWSTPLMVSPSDPGSVHWFPEIVVDRENNVHLFWSTGRQPQGSPEAYDTIMHCLVKNDTCNPSEIVAFGGTGAIVTRPAAIVDDQNVIHLLSRRQDIFYSRAPASMATSPKSWLNRQPISRGGAAAYSDLVISENGHIHVVWSEQVPYGDNDALACPGCSDIFYRRSVDFGRTWSTPIDLTNTDMGSEKPQIIIGEQGALFVVWEEGFDFYAARGEPVSSGVVSSFDGGETWSSPTMFISPKGAPEQITAGIDGQGNVVVVWGVAQGNDIFYQVSRDQARSWSPPKLITGVMTRGIANDLDTYHMASDSAGHLHLVLAGRIPNDQQNHVLHFEWDGMTWSPPTPIYSSDADLPEWPRIVVANGNQLHVVWFVRAGDNIWGGNVAGDGPKIWYTHGRSLAPMVVPEIEATFTPTPDPDNVATPTPTSTPTKPPTATPTLEPSAFQAEAPTGVTTSIYTDVDDVILLLQSLLPAAGIIAVVVITVRLWRR